MTDIDKLLSEVSSVHFIGIGGSGMCPLAEILHSKGYKITGSDNNEGDTLNRIRDLGIPVVLGQKAENIRGAEMIVYTAALLEDNPELLAAKASGIPTFPRAKLFGAISRMFGNCICISGTHGKTTVTAMLTQILIECGLSPSAVIGGKLPLTDSNGVVGDSDILVCEACEFVDTFLELSPSVSVILNIDKDHLDYFKTVDNLIHSFTKFAELASKTIVINGDDENTRKAVRGINEKTLITFGLSDTNDFYARDIELDHAFARFTAVYKGTPLGRVRLAIPGEHNILNALAAMAAALDAGVEPDACIRSMEHFRGAGRRFEVLGTVDGITVADDYAHHPEELRVTLNAAMQMGYKRVWAVFQPFTFSRTATLLEEFASALQIPQRTVLTAIMGAREVNTYNIHTTDLAVKIPGCVWFETFDETADYMAANAQSGDLILTLGCGDVYKVAHKILRRLNTPSL